MTQQSGTLQPRYVASFWVFPRALSLAAGVLVDDVVKCDS